MLARPAGSKARRVRRGRTCACRQARRRGLYRLIGAAVAFPGFGSRREARPAAGGLHKPIHGYEEQLASGVDRFMLRLKAGAIYGRCNWFVAPTQALRWVGEPPTAFAHVTPENAGETLFVRSERQTLRRLPETEAVLFTSASRCSAGSLSPENIAFMGESLATIPDDEAGRRGAAFFAQLQAYAEQHGAKELPHQRRAEGLPFRRTRCPRSRR